MEERIIFHIDVNSAFLSWEAASRKFNNNLSVDLLNVASAVCGDENKRKGIILAKSEKAKKMGVKTGQSIFEATKLCPSLVMVPPNFETYAKYSNAFKALLQEYSPLVEQFSIDECFVDFTSSQKLFGNYLDVAFEIKERIKNELGFSVNVGVSTNKLLAKMASDLQKPDKLITLFPNEIEEKMLPLKVGELFMVGRKTREKLNLLGINTIRDLANKEKAYLIYHFKNSTGEMLYNYSHGIDYSPVVANESFPKSIGNSTTLPRNISTKKEIKKVLLGLSESVGMRLRKRNAFGNIICLSLRNSSFSTISKQMKLFSQTNSTDEIYKNACLLLEKMFTGEEIRLVGLSVNNLSLDNAIQISLLQDDIKEKNTKKGGGQKKRKGK